MFATCRKSFRTNNVSFSSTMVFLHWKLPRGQTSPPLFHALPPPNSTYIEQLVGLIISGACLRGRTATRRSLRLGFWEGSGKGSGGTISLAAYRGHSGPKAQKKTKKVPRASRPRGQKRLKNVEKKGQKRVNLTKTTFFDFFQPFVDFFNLFFKGNFFSTFGAEGPEWPL